jgi:hypothetical protein
MISKGPSILQYLNSPRKTKNCRWWCYSDLRSEAKIPIFHCKLVQFSSANYWKPKSIRRFCARKSISSASAHLQECYESYNRPHSMLAFPKSVDCVTLSLPASIDIRIHRYPPRRTLYRQDIYRCTVVDWCPSQTLHDQAIDILV